MKTLKIENREVSIKYKNESGSTVEDKVKVTAQLDAPLSSVKELGDYILTLHNDSPVFNVIQSSLESVFKSKTAYKLANYELKPGLDSDDVPEELTLEWVCEAITGGRFGYAKAAEEQEAIAEQFTAKIDAIKEMVEEGLTSADLVADKIADFMVERTKALESAVNLRAKAAEQSAKRKATKAAKK